MKSLATAAAAILILSGLGAGAADAQSAGFISGARTSSGASMTPMNQPQPRAGGGTDGRGGGWRNGDGRDDRQRWRRRCIRRGSCGFYGYGGYGYGYGYGYGSIGDDSLLANAYGYFAQEGGVEARNGGARFDYDRGYPYEHYSQGQARETIGGVRDYRRRECSVESTRDHRSGRQVDVRVCRN